MNPARLFAWLLLACGLVACGGEEPEEAGPETALLGPEDLVRVEQEPISVGPRISGTLEPAERAQLDAETGGEVESVSVEVGQTVTEGQTLARIGDAAPRDNLRAARAGLDAARDELDLAEREIERTAALVEAGALAQRDLDVARTNTVQARAAVQQAQAQVTTVEEQVDASIVEAPFSGTISERSVGEGDIVAPGAPLFTVIDLSSLRLDAAVPVSALGELDVGTRVVFEVQGLPERKYIGRIQRIAPAVDPGSRQIPILATIPNPAGELLAGLFAEGRVATALHEGLVVPLEAVDLAGDPPTVLRVEQGVVNRVVVSIGLVDEATERVELTSGVQQGDLLLYGPARELTPGTRVELPEHPVGAPPDGGA